MEFVSKCKRISISNIPVVKQGPLIVYGCGCSGRIPLLAQSYLCRDNLVIGGHTLEICTTIQIFLINKDVV